ncbi:hypothetical protein ACFOZ1_12840 [Gracilibacillus marinus]|uniref:Uncharacterized protein n=1 Tax=Gracilibacillus marinus TaxID=630535 RepID=A0ABV8VW28_9BACI
MENYNHFSMDHYYLTTSITDSVIVEYKTHGKKNGQTEAIATHI